MDLTATIRRPTEEDEDGDPGKSEEEGGAKKETVRNVYNGIKIEFQHSCYRQYVFQVVVHQVCQQLQTSCSHPMTAANGTYSLQMCGECSRAHFDIKALVENKNESEQFCSIQADTMSSGLESLQISFNSLL
ncbi:UNVERIFIED_CONTAM: hypothetical protein FKN15_074829 [Acipenser sinensis]